MGGSTPAQESKSYRLSNPNRLAAMRELFPSVTIAPDDKDYMCFDATPEQAQLYREAVDAHLDKVENLEGRVDSGHESASAPQLPDLFSPTTKGLLSGLGVGVFTAAIVIFPIIPYAVQSGDYRSGEDTIHAAINYQVLSVFMGGLIGGISGAALGFYANIQDRLRR